MRFFNGKKPHCSSLAYKPKLHTYYDLKCSICDRVYSRYYNKPFKCVNCSSRAYSHYWKMIRKNIIERDDEKCQVCQRKQSASLRLHVHHKDKNRMNNLFNNLITLCNQCHISIHKHNLQFPTSVIVTDYGVKLKYDPYEMWFRKYGKKMLVNS